MDCPRCRLALTPTDYEGVEVDLCQSCWGFWFDRGELEQVIAQRELGFSSQERSLVLDARTAWDSGPDQPAACPQCGETMERISYDESVHLVIDRCAQHGIWLDTGEIKKVQAIAEKSAAIHQMLIRKLDLGR